MSSPPLSTVCNQTLLRLLLHLRPCFRITTRRKITLCFSITIATILVLLVLAAFYPLVVIPPPFHHQPPHHQPQQTSTPLLPTPRTRYPEIPRSLPFHSKTTMVRLWSSIHNSNLCPRPFQQTNPPTNLLLLRQSSLTTFPALEETARPEEDRVWRARTWTVHQVNPTPTPSRIPNQTNLASL